MKLAAIYNIWDGIELLRGSMMCMKDDIDLFILIYQDVSNFGEKYSPLSDIDLSGFDNVKLVKYEPDITLGGNRNETKKRNIGLQIAKQENCNYFLFVDCDEYYEDFHKAKIEFCVNNPEGGSVCKIYTYFKKPTLRFEKTDNYYVPFIHKLKPGTIARNGFYPFYVDPTRRVDEFKVIELSHVMHHFSWVRKDINRKINNSSANLARSPKLLADHNSNDLKAGCHVEGFHQSLIEVENKFNIVI